jgi:hypothetical protein
VARTQNLDGAGAAQWPAECRNASQLNCVCREQWQTETWCQGRTRRCDGAASTGRPIPNAAYAARTQRSPNSSSSDSIISV